GPRWAHSAAVWAVDDRGFVKQGKQSVGVARQYCGTVGKVANCQVGVFLASISPRGRALVDKRLYLPCAWVEDPARCREAEVPEEARTYQRKPELALSMLRRARALGHLSAGWVTGDDDFGNDPDFRDGVAAEGWRYVLEVPANMRVWPEQPSWERPHGRGRPRTPARAAAAPPQA